MYLPTFTVVTEGRTFQVTTDDAQRAVMMVALKCDQRILDVYPS